MHALGQTIRNNVLPVVSFLAKEMNEFFKQIEVNNKKTRLDEVTESIMGINQELIDLEKKNSLGLNLDSLLVGGDSGAVDELLKRRNELLKEQKRIVDSLNDSSVGSPSLEASPSLGDSPSLGVSDDNSEELNNLLNKTRELEDNLDSLSGKSQEAANNIQDAINQSTENWSSNLADAILNAGDNFKSLGDFAKAVFKDIATQFLKTTVTNPLVDAAVGFFNPSAKIAPTMSLPSTGSMAPTQSITNISQPRQSQIINISQSIQPVTGIDESQVNRIVAQQMPSLAQQAKAETLQAIRSGGSARQVIRGAM